MSAAPKRDLELEIAHLLLIDVVGYSKLLVNDQIEVLDQLNRLVRNTECFQAAERDNKLIRVPTGDGMALLFFRSPEEPVRCAIQISEALREHPEIQVRMGVHSGPINQVTDVNDRINVAGTGINVAQRIMDCGDAGHILMSKHVADDLAQYRHWQPHLRDFGQCEVKHGLQLHIVNLCKEGVGNPAVPQKLKRGKRWNRNAIALPVSASGSRWPKSIVIAALLLSTMALALSFFLLVRHPGPSVGGRTAVPAKSIAVLPFENLGTDPQSVGFADGVHDEILTDLAKIADLKVISRTSVMQYKHGLQRNLRDIASALGVAHVVEGSVQRTGNRVRVSAQLIDAATDMHVWAEHYERDLADVFAIQSEIAKAIADQLQAKISPTERAAIERPPTQDLEAFSLYEQTKAMWPNLLDPVQAREELPKAEKLLNEVVKRDPQFLRGWCLLSRIHGTFYWYGFDRSPRRLSLAETAAQTALRLQPDAGETHLAMAVYYYYCFLDYERARAELKTAAKTLPNDAEVFEYTGYIQRRQGNWSDSTGNLIRALEIDPRNVFTMRQLANSYRSQHNYEEQSRILDRVLEIMPNDPVVRVRRAELLIDWQADVKPLQNVLDAVIKENPGLAAAVDDPNYALCERSSAAAERLLAHYPPGGVTASFGVNCPKSYWEGVVALMKTDLVKARQAFESARMETEKLLADKPDYAAAISLLGMIDAALGRTDQAIAEGQRACQLLPANKDSVTGTDLAVNLAQIYAWSGRPDLAIEQIATVEKRPNELSYGLLKLHPYWDSLRDNPGFKKILDSMAPAASQTPISH